MYFTTKEREQEVFGNVDKYSDSYARDTTPEELQKVSAHCSAPTIEVMHC